MHISATGGASLDHATRFGLTLSRLAFNLLLLFDFCLVLSVCTCVHSCEVLLCSYGTLSNNHKCRLQVVSIWLFATHSRDNNKLK